jgi:hypothetical protein
MQLFQAPAAEGQATIATQVTTNHPEPTNPPPPPARTPKCKKGGRCEVAGDEDSDDDEDHPGFFHGVVTKVMKKGIHALFQNDTATARHDGHLETWCEHRQDPNDARQTEEEIFQKTEMIFSSPRVRWSLAPGRARGTVPLVELPSLNEQTPCQPRHPVTSGHIPMHRHVPA